MPAANRWPGSREPNQAKTLEKALCILEVLMDQGREMCLAEIVDISGLAKGTVHRILQSLASRNYVTQDKVSKEYSLGLPALGPASESRRNLVLKRAMTEPLKELSLRCQETVSAAVLEYGQIRYIVRHQSGEMLRVAIEEGARLPAQCCSTGKVLLGDLPPAELRRLFGNSHRINKCTPHSVASFKELTKAVEQARRDRVAYDFEEALIGVNCMAAPVYDSKGEVIAAISISGPKHRLTRLRMKQCQPLLARTARGISRELGYKA